VTVLQRAGVISKTQKQPELRFRALLSEGVRSVRFEWLAAT
jgi:hypothetical protein